MELLAELIKIFPSKSRSNRKGPNHKKNVLKTVLYNIICIMQNYHIMRGLNYSVAFIYKQTCIELWY